MADNRSRSPPFGHAAQGDDHYVGQTAAAAAALQRQVTRLERRMDLLSLQTAGVPLLTKRLEELEAHMSTGPAAWPDPSGLAGRLGAPDRITQVEADLAGTVNVLHSIQAKMAKHTVDDMALDAIVEKHPAIESLKTQVLQCIDESSEMCKNLREEVAFWKPTWHWCWDRSWLSKAKQYGRGSRGWRTGGGNWDGGKGKGGGKGDDNNTRHILPDEELSLLLDEAMVVESDASTISWSPST